jgi:hypothetical protein
MLTPPAGGVELDFARAYDVCGMAQALFNGVRLEPVVGKQESYAIGRSLVDSGIQCGGKTMPSFKHDGKRRGASLI